MKYRCAIWRTDSKEGSGKENVLAINGLVHRQQNQLLVHQRWRRPGLMLEQPATYH